MENEYGDMEQTAGDFVDWYMIRTIYFYTRMSERHRELRAQFTVDQYVELCRVFGHDHFATRGE